MKNLLKINLKPTCLFLYRHKYKPIPSTLYICKPRNSLRVFGDRLSGKYSFLIFSPCNEIVGVKRMVLGKKKKKREEEEEDCFLKNGFGFSPYFFTWICLFVLREILCL